MIFDKREKALKALLRVLFLRHQLRVFRSPRASERRPIKRDAGAAHSHHLMAPGIISGQRDLFRRFLGPSTPGTSRNLSANAFLAWRPPRDEPTSPPFSLSHTPSKASIDTGIVPYDCRWAVGRVPPWRHSMLCLRYPWA